MSNPYVLVVGTGIVVLIAIGLARRRYVQHRKGFRQLLERRRQAGLALARYVMLNRQCSEERAYQRIATFVEGHSPAEDHPEIARLLANDRQGLLEIAERLLHGIIIVLNSSDETPEFGDTALAGFLHPGAQVLSFHQSVGLDLGSAVY